LVSTTVPPGTTTAPTSVETPAETTTTTLPQGWAIAERFLDGVLTRHTTTLTDVEKKCSISEILDTFSYESLPVMENATEEQWPAGYREDLNKSLGKCVQPATLKTLDL